MLRPRMSRIYYEGKFYDYPLKAMNALRNLGLWEAILCGFSYLWARIRPPKDESNYENWLVARFGWRLYRTFFKTYTEKVWGVPVADMPADWAAQRVKNLDLRKAVVNAILPKRGQTEITTLIEEFQYPKYGPGMMWEVCADKVRAAGGTLEMRGAAGPHQRRGCPGGLGDLRPRRHRAHRGRLPRRVSTMPMRELVHTIAPPPPPRGRRRRRRPALSRLPHRGPRGARVAQLPGQLDLHPRHRRRGRAHPELRLVVALPGQGRAHLPGPRVLRLRGRRHVEHARRRAHRARPPTSSSRSGWPPRATSSGATWCASPRPTRTTTSPTRPTWRPSASGSRPRPPTSTPSGATACTSTTTRTTPCTPPCSRCENMYGADHDIWSVNVEEEYHEAGSTGRDAPVLPRRTAATASTLDPG